MQYGEEKVHDLYKPANFEKRVEAVKMLLGTVGEDVGREGLLDTPKRVAKMYMELFKGYSQDPVTVLGTTFEDEDHQELVLVRDIPFFSHCEHHMVPFHGVVHIAYIPNGTIVGLSKLARLVEVYARRLQVQERLTSQIADTIQEVLKPLGVAVIITGEHMCFDDKTEILTPSGWKLFKDLNDSDLVAQVDTDNNMMMSYVTPTARIALPYKGKMMSVKSLTIDQMITPEHRMYFKSEWKYYHAKSQWQVDMAANVFNIQGRFVIPKAVSSQVEGIEREYYLGDIPVTSEQYAKFMGIWMAEGCVTADYKTVITQNPGEVADEIRQLLNEIGIKYWEGHTPSGCIQFTSANRKLAEHFKLYQHSTNRVPEQSIKEMHHDNIKQYLRWYWMGDGSTDKKSGARYFHTSSKELADFTQILSMMIGKTGNVSQYEYNGTRYVFRESDKQVAIVGSNNRSTVDYDGIVYCVSVPTGAILIRRNGVPSISGNCMSMRGVQKPGTKTTTSAMRGVFRDDTNNARMELMMLLNQQ